MKRPKAPPKQIRNKWVVGIKTPPETNRKQMGGWHQNTPETSGWKWCDQTVPLGSELMLTAHCFRKHYHLAYKGSHGGGDWQVLC